jgi:segregation and condensation protein A
MTLSLAQNAIALLTDLAERGEIDPWDVQVIEVIDRFLSKLQPAPVLESGQIPYEAELSQSGQAFLYASMLLLLKADSLARLEAKEMESALETDELLFPAGNLTDTSLPLNLERRIRRRAVAPPIQNRRVTLQELVAQLNLMAAAMAEQKPRRPVARRPRPQSRNQAIRAIAQLAHQENLSEVAAALAEFLQSSWKEVSQGQDWIDFESLLEVWSNSQPQKNSGQENAAASAPQDHLSAEPLNQLHTAGDRVGVFWALLFLSAQSKVELAQEEFYQDLKVRSLADSAALEYAEAPAVSLPED